MYYAKFTPAYLSEMFALKILDQQSWKFLELGNFSVNKSQYGEKVNVMQY